MKASDAIKYLQAYDGDEELIVAWWDRESFSMSEEDWDKLAYHVCRKMDWSAAHEDLDRMFSMESKYQRGEL